MRLGEATNRRKTADHRSDKVIKNALQQSFGFDTDELKRSNGSIVHERRQLFFRKNTE
jgi:hypothetical protein